MHRAQLLKGKPGRRRSSPGRRAGWGASRRSSWRCTARRSSSSGTTRHGAADLARRSLYEGHGPEQFVKDATFQNALEPGSLQLLKSIGDDQQALILVRLRATFGPSAMTLLAARHSMLDESGKITNELVIVSNCDGAV